jgi:hypothetical protein
VRGSPSPPRSWAALALAGLGAFGDLTGAPAEGDVGPGIATVELSQPVSAQ